MTICEKCECGDFPRLSGCPECANNDSCSCCEKITRSRRNSGNNASNSCDETGRTRRNSGSNSSEKMTRARRNSGNNTSYEPGRVRRNSYNRMVENVLQCCQKCSQKSQNIIEGQQYTSNNTNNINISNNNNNIDIVLNSLTCNFGEAIALHDYDKNAASPKSVFLPSPKTSIISKQFPGSKVIPSDLKNKKKELATQSKSQILAPEDEVLVMVYGSVEECERAGGCGMRWFSRALVEAQGNDFTKKPLMDKDGSLEVNFDEWRDYLLFQPSHDLQDILHYWRHATTLDVGEDLSIPDDFSPEEFSSGSWWRHLVAGGVAGMVSRTCTAPLDRLKVFLQVGKPGCAERFLGLRDCWSYMLKEGGVKSLWRGNGINVVKIAPESALKFAAYEQAKQVIKHNLGDPDRELAIYERFAAGSFAGAFSQSMIYPLEVLKTRLALRRSGQYRGAADAFAKIYQTEGLKAFYRGYFPNLLGIIPYAGIDLAVYETLRRRNNDPSPPWYITVMCGAFSSTCGQIASYPLALIRTRLQAQTVVTAGPGMTVPVTAVDVFQQIIRTEGLPGLYRGIAPNFLKVAPAVSISYVIYEKCRSQLGVHMT